MARGDASRLIYQQISVDGTFLSPYLSRASPSSRKIQHNERLTDYHSSRSTLAGRSGLKAAAFRVSVGENFEREREREKPSENALHAFVRDVIARLHRSTTDTKHRRFLGTILYIYVF